MKLAILDIDGTLTQTNEIDTQCFTRALEDCFALTGIETDWSTYSHATDAGIFHDVFQSRFQRSPSAAETDRMRNSFVEHLQRAFDHDGSAFSAMEGAGHFLAHSCAEPRMGLRGGHRRLGCFCPFQAARREPCTPLPDHFM